MEAAMHGEINNTSLVSATRKLKQMKVRVQIEPGNSFFNFLTLVFSTVTFHFNFFFVLNYQNGVVDHFFRFSLTIIIRSIYGLTQSAIFVRSSETFLREWSHWLVRVSSFAI